MEQRFDLVPYGDGVNEALDRVLDAFSRSGVSLAECLDTDAAALSASDLKYFDGKYYGKVPTYAVFMRYLNKIPAAERDEFMTTVAEVESGRTAKRMADIATGESVGLAELRRFNMMKDLNKLAEKRIDRMDKRIASRAETGSKTVDMAARLIAALSDADLLKIKGKVDAIDTEFKEIEVATTEDTHGEQ